MRSAQPEAVAAPMTLGGDSGAADLLTALHERLDAHFKKLRLDRDAHGAASSPLFALEHGLAANDLAALTDAERSWLRRRPPSSRHWLPFVVYCAEIGYRYQGDEYWETFEEATPGWRASNQGTVSKLFKQFATTYGGAIPTGRWAAWFTRICWPITHAILPPVFQRQLAQVLYESRGFLVPELLAEPTLLGEMLSARSTHMPDRFQCFAQNTQLLGQVASALITGEGGSPLILEATLDRLVCDLSSERESRSWLQNAKTVAHKLALRGTRRDGQAPGFGPRTSSLAVGGSSRDLITAGARFTTRRSDTGWVLEVELPDFAPLFRRSSELADAADKSRCHVTGSTGSPRVQGWLKFPGQRVRLDLWPGNDSAMFRLERAEPRLNALLADESRTPARSPWVFRLDADGIGPLLVTGQVRPGVTYLVLAADDTTWPATSWLVPETTTCTGASAAVLTVPENPTRNDLDDLHELGVGVATDFAVTPVGIVPASWGDDGYAEWIVGDDPLLQLSSSHPLESVKVALDEHLAVPCSQVPSSEAVFVSIPALPIGSHNLRFVLATSSDPAVHLEAHLVARVRESQVRSSAGSFREPIVLVASPPAPSLEEVWDSRAGIEILGPHDSAADVRVCLTTKESLGYELRLSRVRLPLESARWHRIFTDRIKAKSQAQRAYEDATVLTIEASDDELGYASLRCERSFSPLRWSLRREHDGLALRLHDNLGEPVTLNYFSFSSPDQATPFELADDLCARMPEGGLFVASADRQEAASILPRHLHDALNPVQPKCGVWSKTLDDVRRLVTVVRLWSCAWLPGDPFAALARDAVVSALTAAIAGVLGGGKWSALERQIRGGAYPDVTLLEPGLAKPRDHRLFREKIVALAAVFPDSPIEERVHQLAEVFRSTAWVHGNRGIAPGPSATDSVSTSNPEWLAEFMLRLGSAPASTPTWAATSLDAGIEVAVRSPILFRAARLLVLAVSSEESSEEESWPWP